MDRRGANTDKYHGLVNQGSTCYLNSVLQVLYMTTDFRERVKRRKSTQHIDNELRDLFKELEKNYAHTREITKKLKIRNVHEQRDAAEHYEKILRLASPEASQVFHGKLKNCYTCNKCQKKSGSAAGFWSLPLPLINANNQYSVDKGISDFFRPSVISGDDQMYCEDCDEKCDAVLECEVSHHPDVLVLLLKRFEFDYNYMTYVKINQPVNVPHTVQIQNQAYKLYAFVEHFGELRFGHYISTICSQDDGRWYIFDDSRVCISNETPKLERSQSAYLLFYRKTIKRSFDHDDQKDQPAAVKKQKQELSPEEQELDQPGRKSPDTKDFDFGGNSSSQQMAEAKQECSIDNSKIKELSDNSVYSRISQESTQSEKKTEFMPERIDPQRPDKSEFDAFCTDDIRSSNSKTSINAEDGEDVVGERVTVGANCETDLRNEHALGQEERQESYNVNSLIEENVQNQRHSCETGVKNCCEGHGECEGPQLSPKESGSQAKIVSCCEEATAKTADDCDKTFQKGDLDACSLEENKVTNEEERTEHMSEISPEDAKSCEFRINSTLSQSNNGCVTVVENEVMHLVPVEQCKDEADFRTSHFQETAQEKQIESLNMDEFNISGEKGCEDGISQESTQEFMQEKMDPLRPDKSESEALSTVDMRSSNSKKTIIAEEGEDGIGEWVKVGAKYGTDLRNEQALIPEESSNVNSLIEDSAQSQRHSCETGVKNCDEGSGECEGPQSSPIESGGGEKIVSCCKEDTAKTAQGKQMETLNNGELNVLGVTGESSCEDGTQVEAFCERFTTMRSDNENGSSESAEAACEESVQSGIKDVTQACMEPNPCFSKPEQPSSTVQDELQTQRTDITLALNGLSLEGQGGTGSERDAKEMQIGRPLTKYDLHLYSLKYVEIYKSRNQIVQEAKCLRAAKSEVEERLRPMPVDTRFDEGCEQRETADQEEKREVKPRSRIQSIEKTQEGDTETVMVTLMTRQIQK